MFRRSKCYALWAGKTRRQKSASQDRLQNDVAAEVSIFSSRSMPVVLPPDESMRHSLNRFQIYDDVSSRGSGGLARLGRRRVEVGLVRKAVAVSCGRQRVTEKRAVGSFLSSLRQLQDNSGSERDPKTKQTVSARASSGGALGVYQRSGSSDEEGNCIAVKDVKVCGETVYTTVPCSVSP